MAGRRSCATNTWRNSFTPPDGYSDLVDHEANFFNAVRSRKKVVENEEFGNNAAIGCHLANHSYFKETAAVWDPAGKKIKGQFRFFLNRIVGRAWRTATRSLGSAQRTSEAKAQRSLLLFNAVLEGLLHPKSKAVPIAQNQRQ